jgi:hypothetical protein
MWIMVGGPYGTGAKSTAGKQVFRALEEITTETPSPLVGEGRDGG